MNHAEALQKIAQGGNVSGRDRNLWGGNFEESPKYLMNTGRLPYKVRDALDEVALDRGGYEAVVYSYSTPIAVKIAGVWLAPDVGYSATTSSKHQSLLHILGAKWIPGDAGPDEVESVIAGDIVYNRHSKTYRKG